MQVDFVRPGQAGLEWLQGRVTALKADVPLQPLTVVVPNYLQGRFVLRQLARAGGYANVHAQRLADLASVLAGGPGELPPTLTPGLELGAVRAAVESSGGGLQQLAHHYALYRELLRLFREMRRQEFEPAAIHSVPGVSEAARSAVAVYEQFRALTNAFADPTMIRRQAARALQDSQTVPSSLREVGPVLVFLPTRLDPADVELLTALGRWTAVEIALPRPGTADDPGNELAQRAADLLDRAGASVRPAAAARIQPESPARVRVLRAPDAAEEVREAVRRAAQALEQGVSLPRQALLYRQTEPYAALVRETLDGAGIPWAALDSEPLSETAPGRALLALLQVAQSQFRREAVLAWLTAVPEGTLGSDAHSSEWDRLTREANIVRGAPQWQNRLEAYARESESEADRRDAEGFSPWADSLGGRARRVRAIAETVRSLADALDAPPDGSSWAAFVGWAEGLRMRFASVGGAWEPPHERASDLVRATLLGLAEADRFPTSRTLTVADFLTTLEAALADRSIPQGRLGEGIVIGPVQSAVGFAFDRVHLLGLTEGAFPPTPAQDAFFPEEAHDPLQRRARARSTDRLDFQAAFAGADGGEITLSAPESSTGRAAFPSRWLLESAGELVGGPPLDAGRFRRLSEQAHPWLRVIHSALDGVRRAPAAAQLGERRLGELASLPGRRIAEHALARRVDLPLGAALALAVARRSNRFTEFDGNLGVLRASQKLQGLVSGARPVSPTSLQSWATCPYRFFLENILRVERTEEPEEEWTIGALERGSLVHDVLETFFVELAKRGRPVGSQAYSDEDVALLDSLAEERMVPLEEAGATGHRLVWTATREAVKADLLTFLARDTEWRRTSGLGPVYFEQAFGFDGADSWPAVELTLDGIHLRLRGRIDRVDLSKDGARAHIFDYKTGSSFGYSGLAKDPIEAGKKLQLAIYARAVRQGVETVEQTSADYWFVSSRGEFKQVGISADSAAVDARLDQGLGLIGRGIADGVFPAVTGSDDYLEDYGSNCKWCPYDLICVASRDQDWQRKQGDGCGSFVSLGSLTGDGDAAD